jgi:hypothetical protein
MDWLSGLPLYGWIFLTVIIFAVLGVIIFLLLRGFRGKFGPVEIGGLREELDSKLKEAK